MIKGKVRGQAVPAAHRPTNNAPRPVVRRNPARLSGGHGTEQFGGLHAAVQDLRLVVRSVATIDRTTDQIDEGSGSVQFRSPWTGVHRIPLHEAYSSGWIRDRIPGK